MVSLHNTPIACTKNQELISLRFANTCDCKTYTFYNDVTLVLCIPGTENWLQNFKLVLNLKLVCLPLYKTASTECHLD